MFNFPSVIRITRVLVGVEEGGGVGERGARSVWGKKPWMWVTKRTTPSRFLKEGRSEKAPFRSFKGKKIEKSHVRGRVHTQNKRGSSVNTELTSLSEFAYCWISSTRVNFSWARFLTWSSNSSSSSSWSTVLWTSPRNVCSTNFRRKRSNYRRT